MADSKPTVVGAPHLWTVVNTTQQMSMARFSPDGKSLFAAGRDGLIHRWDLSAVPPTPPPDPKAKKPAKPVLPDVPELPATKGHNGWVTGIVLQGKDRLLSADTWGTICAWTFNDKETKPAWKVESAHDGWIRQIALSPDGKTLASCGRDQKVCLWSAADGKKLKELVGHDEDVYSVAFHPDGKSLVSGDFFGTIKQWDAGKQWDTASGKPVRDFDAKIMHTLERLQDVGGVRVMRFTPDGKTLVCAGAKPASGGFVLGTPTILLIDWSTGKTTETLSLFTDRDVYIHDLVYHRDGYFIGAVSGQPGNGLFFFLRPTEKKPFFEQKLQNCHSVDLDPDGNRLAVVANAGPFGQNPSMAKEGKYFGNTSPINIWDLPKATT